MKSNTKIGKRVVTGFLAVAALVTTGLICTQQPANAWGWRDRVVHHQMMMNGFANPYYGYAPAAVNPYFYRHHHHW